MRIAIIGAGATGCFAAANIPYKEGREVCIFEKQTKPMQKVKVSGGGRCNVTHACYDVQELVKRYPRGQRFLRKTLYEFNPNSTIDWFNQLGVTIKQEEDGRMFPSTNDSQTIIDAIWSKLSNNKTKVFYNKSLSSINKEGDVFNLFFNDGTSYEAETVLIAVGGYPKRQQYTWLEMLGHNIINPVPSLFTFNIPKHSILNLMGVTVENVTVKIQGTKIQEEGPLLITHWGFSGPVILRCSAWGAKELNDKNYEYTVFVNWLHDKRDIDLKQEIALIRQESGKQLVRNKNPFCLPKRLWEYFLQRSSISDEVKWGELSAKAQNKLINTLTAEEFQVKGKTTFKEEFVTCGGVDLKEVNPKTMESRVVPNLYFAGEILDIDGITGGFNFQHAWSSGFIAAQNMIKE